MRIDPPEDVRLAWEQARSNAEQARLEEFEATALSRAVVHLLRADGCTYAEAAQLLGLSMQRVHQLGNKKCHVVKRKPPRRLAKSETDSDPRHRVRAARSIQNA